MRQIFLSYARSDSKHAEKLYNELKDSPDVHVWFDKEDLLPGIKWEPAIIKAIRESRYFIALLSNDGVNRSGYRNTELSTALEKLKKFGDYDIFLIPTRLDECEPPFELMRQLNYADLFPSWSDGIRRLRKALRIPAPAAATTDDKQSVAKKTSSAQQQQSKSPESEVADWAASSSKPRPASAYHYQVRLVDLDSKHPQLKEVARQLNSVQTFCHLSVSRAAPSRKAKRRIESLPQLYVNDLSKAFYRKISPLKMDFIICLTDRLIAFTDDEDGYEYWNYLGESSAIDERIYFASTHGAAEQAEEAGVSYEYALDYTIVCILVSYFLEIGFHKTIRGCPMDFMQDHDDIIKGLKKRKFCTSCLRKLGKNKPLQQAVMKMLAWEPE